MALLYIFLGGGLGAMARHGLSSLIMRQASSGFPWGTLCVNIIGAFVMGVIIEALALKFDLSPNMKLLLTTGFLGGFTTFSAFSLETVLLIERHAYAQGALYVGLSVFGSVIALMIGLFAVRHLLS